MRLVSVVISTRSLTATRRADLGQPRSSTCVRAGRTSTCGSTSPVGRNHLLDHCEERSQLEGADGVAETKTRSGASCARTRRSAAAGCPAPKAGGSRTRPAFPCASGRRGTCRRAADGHVRLVDDHQRVGGQVVDQRRAAARRASPPTGAGCSSRCPCRLQVSPSISRSKAGALLESLRPRPALPAADQFLEPPFQLDLDRLDRVEHRLPRRDVVRRRVDRKARQALLPDAAGQRVEQLDRLDLVVETQARCAPRPQRARRENVDRVAARRGRCRGRTRSRLRAVLRIAVRRAMMSRWLSRSPCAREHQDHRVVVAGVADAVDRRDRGHDHRVAAARAATWWPTAASGSMCSLMLESFSDVQVAGRYVGLGLVVVVIGTKYSTALSGKNSASRHRAARRASLFGASTSVGTPMAATDVGHREGLARSRHGRAASWQARPSPSPSMSRAIGLRLVAPLGERLRKAERRLGVDLGHESYAPAIGANQPRSLVRRVRKNLAPDLALHSIGPHLFFKSVTCCLRGKTTTHAASMRGGRRRLPARRRTNARCTTRGQAATAALRVDCAVFRPARVQRINFLTFNTK